MSSKTHIDCSDTPVTSCSTTDLSDNVTNTQEETPKTAKTFVKPTTPMRKRSKFRECEKEDPRIQKAFDFLQQPMPQEDSTQTFGKYVAQKLNQFDATKKAILIH